MAGSSDAQIKNLDKQVKDLTKRLKNLEQKVKYIADTTLKSSKDTIGLMNLVEKQWAGVEKKLKEKGGSMDAAQVERLMAKSSSMDKRFYELSEKSMAQYEKEGDKKWAREDKARDAEYAKQRKENEKFVEAEVKRVAKIQIDTRLKVLEGMVNTLMASRR